MFNYWHYWKNIDFRFKLIIFVILIIILYFPLKLVYNLYFNPLYIIKKYYDAMYYANIYYESILEDNTLSSNVINNSLKAYLNKMIEERKKYVLNPEKSEKLMKKYYTFLENDASLVMDTNTSKRNINIKKRKNGYIVHIINGDLVSYELDSNGKIIKKVIDNNKMKKIKYPENAEITFYIVRTWKGLKIDWIKSVYNYKHQDIDQK
ncbi:hypothetical protein [Marinitoga sp. 38H-ov]|uniref:hypothetical protein n=1 Tax=Marinitoga sp. 38H-ov TaxID=1755814 RepID=UPI0013ED7BDE|nr:hypothetical protein [Marinitoga sp. 38H-ov]KAF2955158.1 hypothetical protein AS160_02130 [Marinitoga sp. 38H-ov]